MPIIIKIKDLKGNLVFAGTMSGEGGNDSILMTSGENAKEVLELALQDAMKKLFQDEEFIEALNKSNSPA